ncbi:MAG: 50S ribosomal protein L21 [Candidatus Yonathbacteria bacterium]|nr:50S ribosomal protein L21 [Candidatus Yonathbacteria bacterium]NTW47904.1 50S ribosomal protein L21 [Candidatus Yonathbacteria bacterium]
MAFAVIETGGKQYRIGEGQNLTVEKLPKAFKTGETVVFDKVLLIDDGKTTKIGTPYLEGATVEAAFVEEGKAKKVTVIRYKAKSRYFKKRGHRQTYNKVTVSKIK